MQQMSHGPEDISRQCHPMTTQPGRSERRNNFREIRLGGISPEVGDQHTLSNSWFSHRCQVEGRIWGKSFALLLPFVLSIFFCTKYSFCLSWYMHSARRSPDPMLNQTGLTTPQRFVAAKFSVPPAAMAQKGTDFVSASL